MNYYDEEITISGAESKHLGSMPQPERRSGGAAADTAQRAARQRNMVSSCAGAAVAGGST